MSKSTKIIAGVVAGLGIAALPLGVFALDDTEVVDTIKITVEPTCSFVSGTGSAADTEYAATVANGATASFNNSGLHTFEIVCNNNDGWSVSASAMSALAGKKSASDSTANGDEIPYIVTALPSTGVEGKWTATVTNGSVSVIPVAGGVIATEAAATDSTTFGVTYGAYVGTETAAGLYTGTVTYTLTTL